MYECTLRYFCSNILQAVSSFLEPSVLFYVDSLRDEEKKNLPFNGRIEGSSIQNSKRARRLLGLDDPKPPAQVKNANRKETYRTVSYRQIALWFQKTREIDRAAAAKRKLQKGRRQYPHPAIVVQDLSHWNLPTRTHVWTLLPFLLVLLDAFVSCAASLVGPLLSSSRGYASGINRVFAALVCCRCFVPTLMAPLLFLSSQLWM
jgi:hypothetical protein